MLVSIFFWELYMFIPSADSYKKSTYFNYFQRLITVCVYSGTPSYSHLIITATFFCPSETAIHFLITKPGVNQAQKIFEFQLALWVSNSPIAQGTSPLVQVFKCINNSWTQKWKSSLTGVFECNKHIWLACDLLTYSFDHFSVCFTHWVSSKFL